MADLRYKVVVDDAEAKRRLADLLKGTGVASGAVDTTAINSATDATKKLKDAQLANIESIRRTREERAKEISDLNVLKQVEQEAKTLLAEKRAALADYTLAQRKSAEERRKATEEERKATRAANEAERARKQAERELEKQNRESEKRRKLLEKESSEYYQLNRALGELRKESKDVLAEMFKLERQGMKNTAAYESLRQKSENLVRQTNILDGGIKKIDASLGLHQRHVGNYTQATERMIPIVGRVNSQLADLGLTLDDISTKPNGIAQLGNAFIGLGRNLMAFITTPVGIAITGLASLFALFHRNKQTVMDFNSGLRDISKTTGIAGQDLRDLGGAIVDLSMKLQVVDATKLTEYATVAGQLGVKGRDNILAFTEALAMLETASNISGEEGGAEIARLLTLVDGGVQNVKDFGDEVVNLGNNFAATEREILSNAEAISQNVGLYRIGRQDVLAYATATKSLGIEAEVVGSTFQKTLGSFEKSIRSGKGVADILKVVGGSAADLQRRFREDASGVFQDYIRGLNEIHKAGGSVQAQMERNGIVDIRQRRVIGTLAAGYDTLSRAMETVREANGAMQAEFENGAGKLVNQTRRMGIAWDNFVLSIEDGEGAIGRSVVAIVGFFADLLDQINKTFNPTSLDEFLARLVNFDAADRIRDINKSMVEAEKVVKRVSEFDLNTASQRDLNDIFTETTTTINSLSKAFDKYKKDVNEGVLTEGGKNNFKDFEETLNFLRIRQANMMRLGAKSANASPTGTNTEDDPEADEKAKQAAERAAEAQRRAVERQRALQLQIDQINQQSLRGQLSRDEQEVASIRDKYAKIREEVRKFYADPKNKGLRVDMGGIAQAENFEVSEATTRQETARLVEQLNKQKALYDEYNAYVEKNGADAADRLFGKQAEIAKSYRAELDAEYISLLGKQKSASTGGAAVSSLTQAEEERFKQLQAMRESEVKNDDIRSRKQMDEALKIALSFNDRRLEIERKYQQARVALGEKITKEEEQELKRRESRELSQLATEELSESAAWKQLFADLDALTISQIDSLVKEIESKFEGLSGTFDPIDLASIRSRLNEARDMIIADNPFAAVGAAIREIFNSSADDSKASAEDIKRNWTNLAKATESSFDFINNAVSSTELLEGALGDVGQMALSSLQSIASAGIAVASAVKTAGETMTALEKASVVLSAVQAALVVVQAITSFLDGAAKRRNEELAKEQEYYNALSDTFDILIGKQKELFSERSGKGAMDAYKEALDLVGAKQIANRKSLEAWFAQGASWKSHSNWYNYDKELGNVLSRQRLLNMTGREWEDMLRNQPELWARLPEEVKAFGNSMIAAKGEAEQLRNAIQESITGISLDDVKSEFDSLFSQADLTFGDISDSFYKHMQKAVLRMVQDGAMTDRMKAWYDNLMTAMDDENLTKAESDALKADYQAIVEAGQKRTKEIMDLIGYEAESSSSSLRSEGITRATEEQFSEYLGINRSIFDMNKQQLAATQAQTGIQNNLLAIAGERLISLNAIQVNTANTVLELQTAVRHLRNIDSSLGGRYAG